MEHITAIPVTDLMLLAGPPVQMVPRKSSMRSVFCKCEEEGCAALTAEEWRFCSKHREPGSLLRKTDDVIESL